jgi:hypothetical protein
MVHAVPPERRSALRSIYIDSKSGTISATVLADRWSEGLARAIGHDLVEAERRMTGYSGGIGINSTDATDDDYGSSRKERKFVFVN